MKANQKFLKLRNNDTAALGSMGINTLLFIMIGTVVVILGVVLNLRVIAGLLPTLADSSVTITQVFNSTDWGDQVANDISPVFATVIALVVLLTAVALVFSSVIIFEGRRRGFV